MKNIPTTLLKRLLPLSVCFLVAGITLSYANSQDVLSGRTLGIALLTLGIGGALWAAHILKRTATEFRVSPAEFGVPAGDAARKRRLLGIRIGKVATVFLGFLLIFGLLQNGPWLPRVVGATINVCIMAAIIRVIVRLQKTGR